MRQQPGFLGYQLYHSLRQPTGYVMVAQWESEEAHRRAGLDDEETRRLIGELRQVARTAPVLYETVATADPERIAPG
jgi:quinol monooxygenase YgiN